MSEPTTNEDQSRGYDVANAHQNGTATKTGLKIDRVFSDPDVHPFDQVEWTTRTAEIKDETGKHVFKQDGVEFPATWSQLAVNVVASKYFYGDNSAGNGSPADGKREYSVRQLIRRVGDTIAAWGFEDGYFDTTSDANAFQDELEWMLVNQHGAFNSPVWFNVGLWHCYGVEGSYDGYRYDEAQFRAVPVVEGEAYKHPQGSACFTVGFGDSIPEIYERAAVEGRIFKYGSGAGSNNSRIRSRRETVRGGGTPSGPLSFMSVYDAVAKVTKSGGRQRRAAKMEILDDWHPDILEFIRCKGVEEAKAHALIREGYESNFNGEAYSTVCFQNSNMSVRFSDAFMAKVEGADPDKKWQTRAVTTGTAFNARGERMPEYDAEILLNEVAQGTWKCGDPGVQFTDVIQKWHTCKNSGPILETNPCCFVYETYVDTSEGRIPIGKLAEMDAAGQELPYAFGFDRGDGLPALRRIKRAWKAGDTKKIARVTTVRGLVFESTPDHRYLMHDGNYVEACRLKPGQRLRKINRQVNSRRANRKWLLHKVTSDRPNGCTPQNRWMWEQVHGPLSDEFEVHHVNEDPTDDRLSNFQIVKVREHQSLHSKGSGNGRFIAVDPRVLVEVWEQLERDRHGFYSSYMKVTPSRWNKFIRDNGLKGKVPFAGSPTYGGRIQGMTWDEFSEWIDSQRCLVNDRVQSVEIVELDAPVAVYDIEVDGVHNFGIGSKDSVHSIVVSNSEFVFLPNTACNLASLNLLKFVDETGWFDFKRFRAACSIFFIAQEILVGRSGYPTEKICENSHDFRPLGLGYCNLGALLMNAGLPYDSDEGRSYAAAITAIMHGQANLTSVELAKVKGPFAAYAKNRDCFLEVMEMHRDRVSDIDPGYGYVCSLKEEAEEVWFEVLSEGRVHGFRNAQATLLAPTGTIGLAMDAATTGVEPDISLVKYKVLAGGGNLRYVNTVVPSALKNLGYDESAVKQIVDFVNENDTIEGAPHLKPEHFQVFDCAFPSRKGGRCIAWKGHMDMMAAVQPFLAGAISKTCNVPEHFSVNDIRDAYIYAWKQGLKCVAIYRDNSKGSQPLSTKAESKKDDPTAIVPVTPRRERLPVTRRSLTHKFTIGGHEGYVNVGFYPDGRPGEIFVTISKEGSTISGLMDAWATAISLGLQYGMPLQVLVDKFAFSQFEPSGSTRNPDVPFAKSLTDYVSRWLGSQFLEGYRDANSPSREYDGAAPIVITPKAIASQQEQFAKFQADAPLCDTCGSVTVRNGTCYRCFTCGSSLGCS